jgi:molybdopterin-biosynthesis enzyme MoeA-like protein
MAGAPSIMQAMLDEVALNLKSGVGCSRKPCARIREGDIGMQLGEIARANPEVAIGSYPFFDPQRGPEDMVERVRRAHSLALSRRKQGFP